MENSDIDYEGIFKLDPYSLCKEDKERLLTQNIKKLCEFHYKHCKEYRKILDALGIKVANFKSNNCHIERREISLIDSKKDCSPMARTICKDFAHTCKNDKETAHSNKNLDSNKIVCHTEPLGEVSSMEYKQNISYLRTQYDKNVDSNNFAHLRPAPTQMRENLESNPINHAHKTTNSSNCSVALEALAELEGRSYLSDNDYPSNSANHSNCIDKGEFLQNLESKNYALNPLSHPDLDRNLDSYYNAPFLPVRLFKHYALKSIEKSEIIKTMTSSGTSGQSVSQIFLDKQTSLNQTKALSRIMQSFIGNSRMPMIIIDSSHLLQNRAMFSARGAGVLGFSMFAREKIYALDKDMNLNIALIRDFIEKHKGKKILLFGFTFIVWQHFYNELKRLNIFLDLKDSILIHGGGWKKLIAQAVSKEHFKNELESVCGIKQIYNYYGMVEQTGSIYMECECGVLHTPIFADIIVRRARDFSIADKDEEGILELVSLLPYSYPGHIILSEDVGTILGEDDCPCGRKGKYFSINGRIQNAEIRGCSDTYEQK
ncbi:acyl-protein synthetase [Helicobacter labetoulli]|uniref:LuxE/PaaK family acyltransferase n=1 Tax=Helicobacter labetoulli TaxID=2315333 RepID=UPI001FC9867D|nr:acyl-protein synthetase [Helicobacter labetoulli]